MNTFMRKIFSLICLLLFSSATIFAYEDPRKFPDVDPKYIDISILDPNQKVGYTVGDYIEREIYLTVKEPFKLIEESLPIVGYEKRYRGQLLGISLKAIDVSKESTDEFSTYLIKLNIKSLQIMSLQSLPQLQLITIDLLILTNQKKYKNLEYLHLPLPSHQLRYSEM